MTSSHDPTLRQAVMRVSGLIEQHGYRYAGRLVRRHHGRRRWFGCIALTVTTDETFYYAPDGSRCWIDTEQKPRKRLTWDRGGSWYEDLINHYVPLDTGQTA